MANADFARVRRYQKPSCDSAIVTQNISVNQEYRISELSNYISDHRLTESVEILENVGFTGDLAVFLIANLQILEVAV